MLNGTTEFMWYVAAGLALAGLWYCFWVQPNDQIMTDILVCMGDDQSREAYDRCRDLIVGGQS